MERNSGQLSSFCRRWSFALPALLALGIQGCYHPTTLVPATGTRVVTGPNGNAGEMEKSGVRVVMDGSWKGDPKDLSEIVTPVQVSLENRSGKPIRVRYNEFSLKNDTGFAAKALPPFKIQREGVVAVTPAFPHDGFYLAPPYAPYYPGFPSWSGPFAWDSTYYDDYLASWQYTALPTNDMLQKAMPEGVLQNNGTATGYIYFQRIGIKEGARVNVEFDVVDASAEQSMGSIVVPFVVKKG